MHSVVLTLFKYFCLQSWLIQHISLGASELHIIMYVLNICQILEGNQSVKEHVWMGFTFCSQLTKPLIGIQMHLHELFLSKEQKT